MVCKTGQALPPASGGTSSSYDPLDALRRDFEGRIGPIPETEMVVDQSHVQPLPKAGPSRLSPRKHPPVQIEVDDDEVEIMEIDRPEQQTVVEVRTKRFRRVFLDHQQWLSRDPGLVREWQRAEAHKKSMMALYGHPFESYRPQVCV